MLAAVNKNLMILRWIMLVVFMIVLGVEILPKSIIGALVAFSFALLVVITGFLEYKENYMRGTHRHIIQSNPFLDIILFGCAIYAMVEANEISPLFMAGIAFVLADLAYWLAKLAKA